ncbi:tetratricopeptide repeat protein [Thermodesulfobacteriota bacterium]
MVRRVIFAIFLLLVLINPAWADTIKEIITSDPPGADIYWGKTKSGLQKTGLRTPQTRSIQAKTWEPWSYQVKSEGYYDSEVVSRPKESGDRKVHFVLKPKPVIKEIITSDPPGADIYWGKTEAELKKTGIKTPNSRSIKAEALESWSYQVKMEGYYDSEVDLRPEESEDRKIHFTLNQIPILRETISSEPSDAGIYWGKAENDLINSGMKTPYTREIEGTSWSPYCYQVKKQGYIDSKIVCRPEEFEERKVSFNLSPTSQKLKEEQDKKNASYIERQKKSSQLEPKDSLSAEAYDYFNKAKAQSSVSDTFLISGTSTKGAISLLESATKENPYYHAAFYILGLSYLRNENFEEAEKNLTKSIELKPVYQPGFEKLGDLYVSQKKYDTAIGYYNKALELGSPTFNIYYQLGGSYLQAGDLNGSEKAYLGALDLMGNKRPKNISSLSDFLFIHSALAEIYLKKRDLEKSWEHLKISSSSDDKLIPFYEKYADQNEFYSHVSLGQIYFLTNRYKNAVKYYERALYININNFKQYYELGVSCKALKQYRKAIKYLSLALELEPDHYYGNLQLGIILGFPESNIDEADFKVDYAKSIEYLNKTIDLNADDPVPYYYLGKTYLHIGKTQEALKYTEKALTIEPDYATFHQLGDIYFKVKDYSNAAEQYRKALLLNDNSSIRLLLANCLLNLRNYTEASTFLKESIQLYPQQPLFLNRLGDLHIKKGSSQTAISIYKQTLKIDPNNFHAQFEIASAYTKMNKWNEAENYFLNSVSINPGSFSANYNCGIIYIKKEQYNNALKYLAKALSIRPDDTKTKEVIGRYQHKIDITALSKIKSLSQKADEKGIFSKLLLHSVNYNKGNDLWIKGTQETEFKDGENIVSPKIYEALEYFNKIKVQIVTPSQFKGKPKEASNFLSIAVDLRISGINKHSEGYYKKESEYNGEYEKGLAKISLADDNYVDFLILLQEIGMEHNSIFDELIKLYLEYNLEYYKDS